MVDFDRPVIFEVNGEVLEVPVTTSRAVLEETTWERGDPNYQFEARISWTALQEMLRP